MGILGAPVLVLRIVYLRLLLGQVCAPTSSLTSTSDGISLEGEVTSSHVSAFGIPSFALVSVALYSLLEGLVTSWLREDASASSVSLDDVISTTSTSSLLLFGLFFLSGIFGCGLLLDGSLSAVSKKSRASLDIVLPYVIQIMIAGIA